MIIPYSNPKKQERNRFMNLVIAEKPSVARSIAAVIGATDRQEGYLQGNGYLVSWCIGHLVSFADAGMYDERAL